jgi:putative FmdB family regulatory protein
MPMYEYRCSKCDRVFEIIQKFSDAPLTVHEDCGGQVERLISAPAIQFKGTGWYVTDYARSNSSSGKSSDSKDSKGSDSSASSKSSDSSSAKDSSSSKSDSSSSSSKSDSSSSSSSKKD